MSRSYTFDKELELKDAGLLAATAACQVGGSDQIIDLGSQNAAFSGVAILDVSAIEVATGDEAYRVVIQGSNSATFASGIANLAELTLGAAAALPGGAGVSSVGRYEVPFFNEQDSAKYRYLRAHVTITGTIATGINFTARIARASGMMP